MLFKLQYFIIFLVLFLIKPTNLFAVNVFYDDFSTLDSSKWIFDNNSGNVASNNGVMELRSGNYNFPYVLNKNPNIFPENSNFILEIRFRYEGTRQMGNGIGIGFTNPDSLYNFYQFQVWSDIASGSFLVSNDFSKESQGGCKNFQVANDMLGRIIYPYFLGTDWHVLKVEKQVGFYKVTMDGNEVIKLYGKQCTPKNIWFGNRLTGGRTDWSNLDIDYVRLDRLDEPVHKIILIPGLGASWNTDALVRNAEVGDSEWKMTPFVRSYDGLINAFLAKGLVRNRDFYVWNYDWRKPVATIEAKLGQFINQNVGSSEKVDLVGHSLGGVVGRAWVQDNINDPRVGKVISLGSPHQGTVAAYDAWNGGKLSDKFNLGVVALNIYVTLQKQVGDSDKDGVRRLAPVVKDLLPTFNFIKKNNQVVGVEKLVTKNDFLLDKNNGVGNIYDRFTAVLANGIDTAEWRDLTVRNIFDQVLDIWPDGSPVKYEYGVGDGTVLKKSAKFDGDSGGFVEVTSTHNAIVDKSIGAVFSELGLGVEGTEVIMPEKNKLIFFIGSPAYLDVRCGQNEKISDESGFVVMEDVTDPICKVGVVGTGSGEYHLMFGNSSNSGNWQYFVGGITAGTTKTVVIDRVGGNLLIDGSNDDFVRDVILRDLMKLKVGYSSNYYLKSAIDDVNLKNSSKFLTDFSYFRRQTKESDISFRIIDNLFFWLAIINKNSSTASVNAIYNRSVSDKSLLDRLTRLNERNNIKPKMFGALSEKRLESFFVQASTELNNQNKKGEVVAWSMLVSKLSTEVW